MIISVVLLPDEVSSKQLIDCSRAISEQATSLLQLDGNNFLPHITVAQFEATADEAADLWQDVQAYNSTQLNLMSGGLTFAPSYEHNQTWVEVQFLATIELLELHANILTTSFAQSHPVLGPHAKHFRPHSTVALLDGVAVPTLKLADLTVFKREFTDLKLVVGLNGEHFTFAKTLFGGDRENYKH